MWYVVLFCAGALIGFASFAITTANSNSEKIQEAYNCGFEEGFEEGKKSGFKLATESAENPMYKI